MDEGSHGGRRAFSSALAVLAAVVLVLANVVGGLKDTVFDRATFREAVVHAVDDEDARRALARRLVAALFEAAGTDTAPDASVTTRMAEVLGTPEVRGALGAAADLAYFVLVERGREPIRLDATAARDALLAQLDEGDLATRLAATPTPWEITLLEDEALPSLAAWQAATRAVMITLIAIGTVLLLLAFLLHPVRGGAARPLLLTVSVVSFAMALVFWVAPYFVGLRVADADLTTVVRTAARGVVRPVLLRCVLLGAAGIALLMFRRSSLKRAE